MTSWLTLNERIEFGPAIAYGIVNVTTDSMYSGARSGTPARAIEDGKRLLEAGFDRLDIGAVAARSGPPVTPDAEIAALLPAIEGLCSAGASVAADTFSPPVAQAALEAGGSVINDISGGSPEMFELLGETGAGYVLMHIEGPPRVDRKPRHYVDVVDHLKSWFAARIEVALTHGMSEEQIVIDPGLDFDLSVADNLQILARLGELAELGRPIYLSLSRKDFIGAIGAGSWAERWPAEERGPGTVAATAIGALNGANIHRLHDPESLRALEVTNGMNEKIAIES